MMNIAQSVRGRYCLALPIVICTFLLTLFTAQAQQLVRGPYLQMANDDSIVVRWRTDVATSSDVRYGLSLQNLNNSTGTPDPTTEHEVTLSGLSAKTKYFYEIGYGGTSFTVLAGGDASYSFTTSPVPGTSTATRIWVIGDSGTGNSSAYAVRDAFKTYTGSQLADVWLMLGDNAYNSGTDAEYQSAVFQTYPELLRQVPVAPTLGNHDAAGYRDGRLSHPYYDIFTLPRQGELGGVASGTEGYYSFDYGDIHFISLNSQDTDSASRSSMVNWLTNDLIANTRRWTIVYFHHPPYTKGSHNSDSESQLIYMREQILPILEQHDVDLVLAGHSHAYERSKFIDGHYGLSTSLIADMIVDGGDGRVNGDGAYTKLPNTGGAGAVYAVAGSSGKVSNSGNLDHPVMYISLRTLGSMILDVVGDELNAKFLTASGSVSDHFTIRKALDTTAPTLLSAHAPTAESVVLTFSESVDQTTAETVANYLISAGLQVISSAMTCGGDKVTLTTAPMTVDDVYQVTVNNVEDLSGNVIAGNNTANFGFVTTQQVDFQDGVHPNACYDGTRDSYISQNPTDSSDNHGSAITLLIDGDDPSGSGNDKNSLVKWDLSGQFPAGTVVQSASVTLNVTNATSSTYNLYAVKRDWQELQVTWFQAGNGANWETQGGSGGSDRGALIGTIAGASTGQLTVTLNGTGVALVQDWIDNPSTNYGFIIAGSGTDGLDASSREVSGPLLRPALRLSVILPASPGIDSETPTWNPSANLSAGSIAQSSADLSWSPAVDNVGVAGYWIYRNGVKLTTSTNTTSFQDTGLTADTQYNYQVSAFDAAGNESVLSGILTVTTLPATAPTMHIDDIAMELKPGSRKRAFARANIVVRDAAGLPVENVSVSVSWSGSSGVSGSKTGSTDSAGVVIFDSEIVDRNTTGQFIITVDPSGLVKSGYDYDTTANIEDSACIERVNAGSTQYVDCSGLPPNPDPEEVTISIDSVDLSLSRKGKNWRASATVRVSDVKQTPPASLQNATITGDWEFLPLSGGTVSLGTTSDITDSNGGVVLNSSKRSASNGDQFCFTVTDATHSASNDPVAGMIGTQVCVTVN